MPVILFLVSVVAGIGFWWWRLKALGEAADEVSHMAGKVIGKYKRNKFRKKVEGATLTAVDDPIAAAVIMMMAVAQEAGPLDEMTEAAIRKEVVETMGHADTSELMIFSKWSASSVVDANDVSYAFRKLWNDNLDIEQKRDLLAMVTRIASLKGEMSQVQKSKLERLNTRLGFEVGK
jgi:hypothetical protein